MTSRIYPVQKSGNLFIVKASIGRSNAPPSILQLPVSRYINGILGMDFLTQFQAVIDTGKGFITLP